jgi:hypothetical protein
MPVTPKVFVIFFNPPKEMVTYYLKQITTASSDCHRIAPSISITPSKLALHENV